MIIDNKYTTPYKILHSQMDAKGRASTLSLINIAQDIAGIHYNFGQTSIQHLQEKNQTWIISKQRFEFTEYPLGLDELVLQTWPHEPKGISTIRDFVYSFTTNGKNKSLDSACKNLSDTERKTSLEVKEENIFMRGISSWMIIDLTTGRPIKATDYNMGELTFSDDSALDGSFPKITMPETWESEVHFTPSILDIDINSHVNNTNYVKWILSFMNYAYCKDKLVKTLETYFIKSAMLTDKLICRHSMIDDKTCVHSIVTEDGTDIFRARTTWATEAELARELPLH